MSNSMPAAGTGLTRGRFAEIMSEGIYKVNPVTHQVLGICIFLAVTNRIDNSLVMGAALIFVLTIAAAVPAPKHQEGNQQQSQNFNSDFKRYTIRFFLFLS